MSEPKTTPQYTKAPDTGLRVMPRPITPQSAESLPPPPVYSFENPPPRELLRPEPAVGAEPGFYQAGAKSPFLQVGDESATAKRS
ncbi:putative uncharacterized protein [Pseudomonas sp. StFLB209]|uniref:hypothetical protein n=1 Tax=Pseudomonas sp. StFLB209 TaxID=1028989 RepID=UPI0004F6D90C|nr:hypothetical protein [Pseudomonas sp. StFLB209]BAP42761.1 putative uncharacterized protein [Pseudomonas sp. StFLB209]